MDNEEFQKIVLEQFKDINKQFKKNDKQFKDINAQFKKNDKQFKSIDEQFKNVNTQLQEHTQILKALMHSAEVNKAEHDKMMIDIAHIKGDTIALRKDLSKVEIITSKNCNDIALLKAVK